MSFGAKQCESVSVWRGVDKAEPVDKGFMRVTLVGGRTERDSEKVRLSKDRKWDLVSGVAPRHVMIDPDPRNLGDYPEEVGTSACIEVEKVVCQVVCQ